MTRPTLYITAEEKAAAARVRYLRWLEKDGSKEKQYEANKKTQSQRFKRWQQAHPEKVRSKSAAERAMRLQRIPQWADLKAIEEFYNACPVGHHVDHIIPLRGKTVSGLHVVNNLQYLPSIDNLKKGNSFQC